jgi:hypothetical protein
MNSLAHLKKFDDLKELLSAWGFLAGGHFCRAAAVTKSTVHMQKIEMSFFIEIRTVSRCEKAPLSERLPLSRTRSFSRIRIL